MKAFIDLLTEKGFEKVTVNDIAERANVNRGTVYLHYADKFDLLDKCVEKYVGLLINHCDDSADTTLNPNAFKRMLEYLENNFAIYYLLLSIEGVGFFRRRLYDAIAKILMDVLGTENKQLSNSTTIHFVVSGFIGVLDWWISNSMPCDAQEITERLMFLL
jgi:AcrR family transcriptional regulator